MVSRLPTRQSLAPHQARRLTGVLGLLVIGQLQACTNQCRGPQCIDEWPRTRLLERSIDDLDKVNRVRDSQPALLEGTDEEGADWSISFQDATLWIGQPELGRVVAHTMEDASERDRWTGPDSFGQGVGHVTREDGTMDLWVSAPSVDRETGALYRFAASAGGTEASNAALKIVGDHTADRFGSTWTTCPDLTGDGEPDILAAAPWYNPATWTDTADDTGITAGPAPLAGAVYLLRSESIHENTSGALSARSVSTIWWGEQRGEQAGASLLCDADHDGDGIADIVVGSPLFDSSDDLRDAGRVYIISGAQLPSSGPLSQAASVRIDGERYEGWLGSSSVSLDLDPADGEVARDLAIGAAGDNEGSGRVYLYQGQELARGGTPKPRNAFSYHSSNAGHFGSWLTAGDMDGDGSSDLVVGGPDVLSGTEGYSAGGAWIFLASSQSDWGLVNASSTADHRVIGTRAFQQIGRGVHCADLDGDGADELLLATRAAETEEPTAP